MPQNNADTIASGRTSEEWKVHTPRLLAEIMTNNHMGVLSIPINIFQRMLAEVASRAMQLGDLPLDRLMIRLALYEQGDPASSDYNKNAALEINEARARDVHSEEANIATAISLAHQDEHVWEPNPGEKWVRDWRSHVGSAVARAWPTLPFAARVAIAIDALHAASKEEWE